MANPNRTTKAERRAAKRALATARRRASQGGLWAAFWGKVADTGIAEHARLHRPQPTTWLFRGNFTDTSGFARGGRVRFNADPKGDYLVKVATGGAELPAPPPKPAWSTEVKLSLTDVDPEALRILFPDFPALPSDQFKRLGDLQ